MAFLHWQLEVLLAVLELAVDANHPDCNVSIEQ
jgi:hypothetical protein